ncbi:MAG TPA: ATP-binding cassette domain-containing protein [Rhodocyclaceae bacterium]|nr:ATP-binding cassette domain-containing protein [Betaproteobacteria bacterium]HMU99493.1 ATP-binding cassette domain-containing protein [Rhodocyclaceae bacterium]HMV21887.1 ATP-binding cassette domain-containing protein [Rhodocyclaceae bacterium]HNM21549.1 ATP-binding cassette domain-containing protein [Rhodocyclaceae bacterium]HNM80545.1 ATP-binding cassette domain-containing protein [Rhodocyclaceae bacterium]
MTAPLLAARDLVVGWDGPVTGPLDLTIAPADIVGLAGPNGAGKSTFLAALAGGARVFSGRLEKRPGLRTGFQTQTQPPVDGLPLSGRELLGLTAASPDGLPPWLADCLDWRLDRLSGGQRQYLALWAILQSPVDLLLLDEPTNNLDAAGCDHLVEALRQRAAAGCGVVLVSHDAEFAAAVCHRTMLLGEGRR